MTMGYDADSLIAAFDGAYRYLSNFYVEDDGFTVEHRFQAAKATDPAQRRWVLSARTPHQAKRRGNQVALREDWEQVKDSVMLDLVRAKFAPGSKLADWLMNTWPAELQEGNTWGDQYWGASLRTGRGQNRLGEILMQVREELVEARIDEEETYEALKAEEVEGDW
jgi:hypothetical protein